MALVSPGTSVTVTDESFYVPVSAPTVPLFFVASRESKYKPDGVTIAPGTEEFGVVRLVTSIAQSTDLYGVPYFRIAAGDELLPVGQRRQLHGDARNEYGLFALNQFLEVGNRAYVVRANVDLSDTQDTILVAGAPVAGTSNVGNGTVGTISVHADATAAEVWTLTATSSSNFTVTGSVSGAQANATVGTAYASGEINFTITAGATPFTTGDVFTITVSEVSGVYLFEDNTPVVTGAGNGNVRDSVGAIGVDVNQIGAVAETWTLTATSATNFTVSGSVSGAKAPATVGTPYNNGQISFTIVAGSTPFVATNSIAITITNQFVTSATAGPLGANDAMKRATIVAQLAAAVNSNNEVRSELYEYNIICCPGYPEIADELQALAVTIGEEAMVISDIPMNLPPADAVVWAQGTSRRSGSNIAYHYPHVLKSNLDGAEVFGASSGAAIRTIAYSDSVSDIWFAPAGANRGLLTGVSKLGYVSGVLGTVTTFVETNLNQGQRDALYDTGVNVNPIAFFPGKGFMVFGQKTSSATSSALDRINVSRMIMYIKRQLRKGSFPFLFEPNDQITRDNLKAMIEGFLNDIMVKRGLYDYAVICDDTNNTPTRIDRNELWADVALKPTKAAEFIYIPIRVVATDAEI